MRDIKFRGKRVDNNKWVYGSLVIQKYNKINKYYIIHLAFISSEFAFFEEVIPETVGQFVELKDSKGIEIYEGDILANINDSKIYVVYFGECVAYHKSYYTKCGYIGFGIKEYYKGRNVRKIQLIGTELLFEIIGNIKENPELL